MSNKKEIVNSPKNFKGDYKMKLILEKTPIDIEQLENEVSQEWLDFFEEIHENGKENEFNAFAESCWEGEPLTIEEFNEWLVDEKDLIKDSIEI